nr:PREDICTED: protein amnionless [Latimeria chalumnae]|eukprot:XP_005987055.1 PREDICTED: protein amnionless [Latimeria chalumnae]
MKTTVFISLSLLFHVSDALYKQWIPNTNFENATNWNKKRVPCATDRVYFDSNMKVSVFVQSSHSITEMYIPSEGEFILGPDAGFAASDEKSDSGCEGGEDVTFNDPDQYQWYDPRFWNAAVSTDDLYDEKYLFSVDEEKVPCQYDDVIFPPETSFRVNVSSSVESIDLRTISLMEKKFTRNDDFVQYMKSDRAKLQFHGQGSITVTNVRCKDKSGCECGNTANHERICSALLQHFGNKCPEVVCRNPLTPIGHCCGICGAIVSLQYSSGFELEKYRNRIIHLLLNLPKYAGVQMAMSKVYKLQSFLGILSPEAHPEIQIVLLDNKTGSQTGSVAKQLANEIMADIKHYGDAYGIVKGEILLATGSNASGSMYVGEIVGIVVGVLSLFLIGGVVFLFISGVIRLPSLSLRRYTIKNDEVDAFGGPIDKGFDNPIFDVPSNGQSGSYNPYSGEDVLKGITVTQTGVHFVNPAYDETDISA